MNEVARCPDCGAQLPEGTPSGMCPACLLKLGLSGAVPALPEQPPQPPEKNHAKIAAVAALALLAIAVFFLMTRSQSTPHPSVVRFTIPIEGDGDFSVSPDGNLLVYGSAGHLWLRRLDAFSATEIAGSEGARFPFWSPDSRHIGFWAERKIKRIPVEQLAPGRAEIVCTAARFTGGVWNANGEILFGDDRWLYSVPAAGGTRRRLMELDQSRQEIAHRRPQLLPDPKGFLFTVESAQPENSGVYSGGRRKVLPGGMAVMAGNYLLSIRDGALVAQAFDSSRLELRGDPVSIRFAEQVQSFSASNTTLAYRAGANAAAQLAWVDRSSRMLSPVGQPSEDGPLSLSPDGRSAVVTRESGLWLLDFGRDTSMRLTFGNTRPTAAIWSPDGERIVYGVQRADGSALLSKKVNGADEPEALFRSPERLSPDSWSPDGRILLYEEEEASGKSAIWSLPLGGDRKPSVVLRSDFLVRNARLSPDGRWMAYVSNETGRDEVYVQGFWQPGAKTLVSVDGGAEPVWRMDGRELLFLSSDHVLMSVDVRPGFEAIQPGMPHRLFQLRNSRFFALSADGHRILTAMPAENGNPASIHVVKNWQEEIGR